MATRSIVTSQPDVECDVCDRRLLRGEQPDVFLAAGRRQLVCELCAPRAVQEGWLRETGGQAGEAPSARPRRRRGLLERLPAPFRARQVANPSSGALEARAAAPSRNGAQEPYDFLDDQSGTAVAPATPFPARAPEPDATPLAGDIEVALATFNASEHPRRVAGVARALGPPAVSVRHSEHAASVATVVVAWELCWYRYDIDLDHTPPVARAVAQGSELGELLHEECVANAVADESGTLHLGNAHADPH